MHLKYIVAFAGLISVVGGIGLATAPLVWPNLFTALATNAAGSNLAKDDLYIRIYTLSVGSGILIFLVGSIVLTITLIVAKVRDRLG